jgi:hypothetical protein
MSRVVDGATPGGIIDPRRVLRLEWALTTSSAASSTNATSAMQGTTTAAQQGGRAHQLWKGFIVVSASEIRISLGLCMQLIELMQ